jgi:tRNA nucleotidyltransferase (CCA-adding enzyme)
VSGRLLPLRDPGELLGPLEPVQRRALTAAAEIAQLRGCAVYLVGGALRDLLLDLPPLDIDLAVEGDPPEAGPEAALQLARELAASLGGEVREHRAFATAGVTAPNLGPIDVAACRREVYPAPGALPQVRAAALREDLRRRDFTVNALAIRLPPPVAGGEWIDPFGGVADLEQGRLRVLHAGSFLDDPTRILRGVRLEVRFAEVAGFRFEPETEELARAALAGNALSTLSGARLLAELLPTLALGAPALERLDALGALAALDPELSWSPDHTAHLGEIVRQQGELEAAMKRAGMGCPEIGRVALLLLARALDRASRQRLAIRLGLAGRAEAALVGVAERIEAAVATVESETCRPHDAVEALARLCEEDLVLLAALGGRATRGWIRRYLAELRGLELTIDGHDLAALGVPRGPEVGRLLHAIRRARLDGELEATGEAEYARRWLAGRGGAV